MASASTAPHFQQFHLTNFISAPSNTTSGRAFPTAIKPSPDRPSTDKPSEDLMAQATRPSSSQKYTEKATMAQENSSPHMGLLELVNHSANTSIEGVLGPNKDGRVRNPVPSKLKGKTDTKQGNFGVMHMGQSPGKKTEAQARDSAAERDAAARRTSENTASRAKAAQQDKYMPPKKRGLEATLNDPGSRGSPFAVSKNDDRNRARPLAPDETKFEQARLLTLLRSINPVTVVDQICKAVAYFGGIPGAPPPEDGIFPESANTRETGALFIGWVAEIFPDLSSRSPEIPTKVAVQTGKKKSRPSAAGKKEIDTGDGEPPNSRNGYGYGPAISAPAWGLPQSLALVNTPIPVPVAPDRNHGGADPVYEQNITVEQLPDTPIKTHYEDPNETAAAKRRRGRPKGSRNKGGKGEGEPDAGSNIAEQQASPEMSSDATNNQLSAGYGMINQQPSMQKSAQTYQYPAQSWNNAPKSQTKQTMVAPADDQLSPEERAVLEAFRHGVDTSITSSITPVPPPVVPVKNATGGALLNEKKRKRAPAKSKQIHAPTNPAPVVAKPPSEYVQASQNTPILPPTNLVNNTIGMGQSHDPIQWSSTATTTPILPPVKKPRVRKPKAPAPTPAPVSTEPPTKTQTASVVSNATPPISASTIPELQATIPQTNQPVARPPAEGLEAHYERFAFSQNGRSNTPTIQPQAQQQQQQPRQQPKPTSAPPQQSTPQLQHQQLQHHHMQQQKSQQGGPQQSLPKDDHKVTQATSSTSSSRPTSTSFYSNQQRAQPTGYNQQYPTHQPSQLYAGHQATPQLANNSSTTTAANTYNNRAYNSHALAQASPQFSQSEASYRTASPHTIAQPSPSFSQTETGFRTNSHTITQPTASYSQPENPYRAPTTHAMAQPTASYAQPRSHTQPQASHQSHYSHFSDSSFIDLPTLESLGHANNNAGSGMGVGGYGQSLGIGHSTSRATSGSNNLYGTSSGLSNAYDTSSNDLLRGVSRSGSNPNSGYGTGSSGLGAFDSTGNTEQDLRERLMRGMSRR